jgi:hypothetical protein
MTVIHLETEAAYDCLNRVKQAAADLEERDHFFSQTVNALDIHWQSPAQQDYLREMTRLRQEYNRAVDQLGQLAGALEKEINQWVAMDQDKLNGAVGGGTSGAYKPVTGGSLGPVMDPSVISLIKDPTGGFFLVSFHGGRVVQIQSLLRGNRALPTYMSRWLTGMGLDSLINRPIQPDA